MAVTGALAAPLLAVAPAGVAFADSYIDRAEFAGPHGAGSTTVRSGTVGPDGGPFYVNRAAFAGPQGAGTTTLGSSTGGSGSDQNERGDRNEQGDQDEQVEPGEATNLPDTDLPETPDTELPFGGIDARELQAAGMINSLIMF